jgi:hypothetical protein
MYLIFDTETTGLPKRWDAPITDTDNWPRCIQIAWQLHDEMGQLIENQDYIIKPDGFNIPYDAERIHGISTELAAEEGISLAEALDKFLPTIGSKVTATIALEADDEILVARLLERGKTSGRADDQDEEKIRVRYQEYNEKTAPLIGYYKEQNKFHAVNGIGTIEEITERLTSVIDNL